MAQRGPSDMIAYPRVSAWSCDGVLGAIGTCTMTESGFLGATPLKSGCSGLGIDRERNRAGGVDFSCNILYSLL